MPSIKDVYLDVEGRHHDIQIDIEKKDHADLTFELIGGTGRKRPYEGPYYVASEANEMQVLPTENKVMTENLVVMPIPYSETSNPEGGITVCIGGY